MKKFIIGLSTGALVVLGLVILAMSNGEPFEGAILKYGTEGDTGYVVLPGRFVVIVENVEKYYQTSGGADSVTISGREGTLKAFWAGYSAGGSSRSFSTYATGGDGTAILWYLGQLIRVEDSGRFLRVGNQRVALGDGIVAILVDKERHVHVLSKASANEVYAGLPPFYREDSMEARCALADVDATIGVKSEE